MVVAAVTESPVEVDAPVEEKVPIVLLLILTVVEVFPHVRPMIAPPPPVELRPVMVLDATVSGFALFPELEIVIPVIAFWLVIFVMVLFERVDVVPPQYE